jgi:hypothetical protein
MGSRLLTPEVAYLPARSPAQLYGTSVEAATAAVLAPPTSFPLHIPAVPGTVLGKRSRDAEGDEGLIYKRQSSSTP